jgi:hypothetical protein
MELRYRGVAYTYEPVAPEMDPRTVEGKYRGHDYGFHFAKPIPLPEVDYPLIYRGVLYYSPAIDKRTSTEPTPTVTAATHPAFFTHQPHQELLNQLSITHHQNIVERLHRRLQSAKERGDQQLVNLLEAEEKQMA